ncbi:SDR family NAD(P)-dependent oxidoreductase [Fontimonas sp. SYSU GA230001]|uniref:SDR family NAD(P)-dependent oxidoreductase n=1 Tax=Fontimonas sp. SYSU GA230001 TaxID=3142450 RepID=UPI0032B3D710
MSRRTALVTGGNRGIGLETARQLARAGFQVFLSARDGAAAAATAAGLAATGLPVHPLALDVSREGAVQACAAQLSAQGVQVDVLINNAGIFPEGDALDAAAHRFVEAIEVNALGPLWCARAWLPGMLARGHGRIVNLSSGYGCFSAGLGGPAAYSIAKAALNAVTLKLAQLARGDVKINAVDPGWVRTRMGGPGAPRPVEDAAADVVWAAMLPADGPNGVLLRQRRIVDW